jgi:hypothetical protein
MPHLKILLELYFRPDVYGVARVGCTPTLRLLVVKLTLVFLFYTKGENFAKTVNILKALLIRKQFRLILQTYGTVCLRILAQTTPVDTSKLECNLDHKKGSKLRAFFHTRLGAGMIRNSKYARPVIPPMSLQIWMSPQTFPNLCITTFPKTELFGFQVQ